MKKFELSLTKSYASSWKLQEALREIVQNGVDQEKQVEGNKMNINYDGENILSISNKSSILSKKSLLLGYTSKANDKDCIGNFGEGYKIALLVLNRLGKKVTIYNYGAKEVWTSKFVKSRRYEGEEVLTIFVETEFIWKKIPNSNLTIEIEGVTPVDYEELINRTLFLQDNLGETLDAKKYGTILLSANQKGKVYVNGLYINTLSELTYGYNIKPEYLRIGRDRDLVSDFDIINITSKMWKKNNNEMLQQLISNDCKDVSYLSSNIEYSIEPEAKELRNSTYETFKKEYGDDAIPVSSQLEYTNANERYENANIVFVNRVQKEIITKSTEYNETIKNTIVEKNISPEMEYLIWKNKNQYNIMSEALEELEKFLGKIIDMDKVKELKREEYRKMIEQDKAL